MKLAYVGLPCQIEALRKLDILSEELSQDWMKRVELKIGLFCRENWAYTCFRKLIEDDYGVDIGDVSKFDIKKGNIIVQKKDGSKVEFPLAESRPYVRIGCLVCTDFSGELADISIGAVGSPPDWSTVIARTGKGMDILRGAMDAGYVEAKSIEEVKPGTGIIKKLSKEKVDGVLLEAEKRKVAGITVKHIGYGGGLDKVKKDSKGKNFEDLSYEIIDTGLCSACGNCKSVCPDNCIEFENERPILKGECKDKKCVLCYLSCPRVSLPVKEIAEGIFKDTLSEKGIGNYLQILAVRASDKKIAEKAQDGGAATAILLYAMEKKKVDGVIAVKHGDDPWKPVAFKSSKKEEVAGAAGTIYSYATTIPSIRGK